jgi:hypothetical protein
MKSIYFSVIILCFSSSIFAQSKNYTGGGNSTPAVAVSKQKGKAHRSTNKEAQPTNSVTILPIQDIISFPSVSFKPASAQSSSEERVDVAGAKVGDKVDLYVPRGAALPGLNWIAWVSRNGEVKIRFTNTGQITQSPDGPQVFKVRVSKQ